MAMTVVDKDCTEKAECFVNTVAEANYERGYKDGYAKAIEEFKEAVVAELEKHIDLANRTYERFENNTDLGRVFGFETAISIVRGKE